MGKDSDQCHSHCGKQGQTGAKQPEEKDQGEGQHRGEQERVCEVAVPVKVGHRACKTGENVEIGQVNRDKKKGSGKRCDAV